MHAFKKKICGPANAQRCFEVTPLEAASCQCQNMVLLHWTNLTAIEEFINTYYLELWLSKWIRFFKFLKIQFMISVVAFNSKKNRVTSIKSTGFTFAVSCIFVKLSLHSMNPWNILINLIYVFLNKTRILFYTCIKRMIQFNLL